jgi:hypothetical protein
MIPVDTAGGCHIFDLMRYVLMLCSDVTEADPAEAAAAMAGCDDWAAEMRRRGVFHDAVGLRPADDATTLKVRNDQVLLSDGPFAETKDQIGGFTMIECADLDEALEVAAQHPWAKYGQIEVRPVWG